MVKPNLEMILKCKRGQKDYCKKDTQGKSYCTLYFPEERIDKLKCNYLTEVKEYLFMDKDDIPYKNWYWGCKK